MVTLLLFVQNIKSIAVAFFLKKIVSFTLSKKLVMCHCGLFLAKEAVIAIKKRLQSL